MLWGVFMYYENLHNLINGSASSRKYFLNLPVITQMELHKYNGQIHSANDLHLLESKLQKYNKQVARWELSIF